MAKRGDAIVGSVGSQRTMIAAADNESLSAANAEFLQRSEETVLSSTSIKSDTDTQQHRHRQRQQQHFPLSSSGQRENVVEAVPGGDRGVVNQRVDSCTSGGTKQSSAADKRVTPAPGTVFAAKSNASRHLKQEESLNPSLPDIHATENTFSYAEAPPAVDALPSRYRVALLQEILLLKEGHERTLLRHFTVAMSVLLSAGAVAVPASLLEAPAIVCNVLGGSMETANHNATLSGGRNTTRRGKDRKVDDLFVTTEVFAALLIALAASHTRSHAVVHEMVRTCYVCGVMIPQTIVQRVAVHMGRVGHANAATRMVRDLCYELGDLTVPVPKGLTDGLRAELGGECHGYEMGSGTSALISKVSAPSDLQSTTGYTSGSSKGDSKRNTNANNTKEPLSDAELLCAALAAALAKDGIADAIRLFDQYVPCLVAPSRVELIQTIVTGCRDVDLRQHLLGSLRRRCGVLDRIRFDESVKGELLKIAGARNESHNSSLTSDRNTDGASATILRQPPPPARSSMPRKGSKLQRALQSH